MIVGEVRRGSDCAFEEGVVGWAYAGEGGFVVGGDWGRGDGREDWGLIGCLIGGDLIIGDLIIGIKIWAIIEIGSDYGIGIRNGIGVVIHGDIGMVI